MSKDDLVEMARAMVLDVGMNPDGFEYEPCLDGKTVDVVSLDFIDIEQLRILLVNPKPTVYIKPIDDWNLRIFHVTLNF